jgi:hypothetical protein
MAHLGGVGVEASEEVRVVADDVVLQELPQEALRLERLRGVVQRLEQFLRDNE